jgi:subtilisin-like proprotein convertase family protein
MRLLGAALIVPFLLAIIHANASPAASPSGPHAPSAPPGPDQPAPLDRRAVQQAPEDTWQPSYLPLLFKGVEREQLPPPPTARPPTATPSPLVSPPPTATASPTTPAPSPTPGRPNPNHVDPVHLPALNFEGPDAACRTELAVMNMGGERSKAVLVMWGAPGRCAPNCAGPLKVECSGLLRPGGGWRFASQMLPAGAKSGTLFSLTARQLTWIGVEPGRDDIVADVVCEMLFFGAVGDCAEYSRFKMAYDEGLEYAGIPLDRAYGAPLAVEVVRTCPGDVTPANEVMAGYSGIPEQEAGAFEAAENGYIVTVPDMMADQAGLSSILSIQNTAAECASVEVWLREEGGCMQPKICQMLSLAPGESRTFDPNDCVGPGWRGSAWLRASQPVAVVADTYGRDTLASTRGLPVLQRAPDGNDLISAGSRTLFAPLTYSEYAGWETTVQVQNLGTTANAQVKVFYLDRSGDTATTQVGTICPRGSRTFVLPVVAALDLPAVGSVRVESLPWRATESDPETPPQPINGTVTLTRYADAARSQTRERLAYELLTAEEAMGWQGLQESWNLDHGAGRIAVPSLVRSAGPVGASSKLAIANLVTQPGFTYFAVLLYDQNGLLDYVCLKVNEKAVEYIDLQTWDYVNPGFKGSTIVSATSWEHVVYSPSGEMIRNELGLGAVAVQHLDSPTGADLPGDEAAAVVGMPVPAPLEFALLRGIPCEDRMDPCRPTRVCPPIVEPCVNCPLLLEDDGSIQSRLAVTARPECETVYTVNVRLAIRHEELEELSVTLTSPAGTTVPLFSNICEGTGNINVILDGSAAVPIGSPGHCAPEIEQFRRYNVEEPQSMPNLASFRAENLAGVWTLSITDGSKMKTGTLLHWELVLQPYFSGCPN